MNFNDLFKVVAVVLATAMIGIATPHTVKAQASCNPAVESCR
jgi:hypothetical protein